MRGLVVALAFGCAVAAPAVALDWNSELLELAHRWPTAAPQSEWQSDTATPLDEHWDGNEAGLSRQGAGWAMLDGWMRGDQLLRRWVVYRFDQNGDAWLSVAEAQAARQAFYSMADANGSGRITSEEFVVGWKEARRELRDSYALGAG